MNLNSILIPELTFCNVQGGSKQQLLNSTAALIAGKSPGRPPRRFTMRWWPAKTWAAPGLAKASRFHTAVSRIPRRRSVAWSSWPRPSISTRSTTNPWTCCFFLLVPGKHAGRPSPNTQHARRAFQANPISASACAPPARTPTCTQPQRQQARHEIDDRQRTLRLGENHLPASAGRSRLLLRRQYPGEPPRCASRCV